MKWYQYIWGIMLLFALSLVVRAVLVVGAEKKGESWEFGLKNLEAWVQEENLQGRSELGEQDFGMQEEATLQIYYADGGVKKQENSGLSGADTGKREEGGTVESAGNDGNTDVYKGEDVKDTGAYSARIYPDWQEQIASRFPLGKMEDLSYLIKNFYIVDASTVAVAEEFNLDNLLKEDLTIAKETEGPQILIYHTHGSEGYIDSRQGNPEDTVVGVGNYLTEILTKEYGYAVYHDTNLYDRKNGKDNRNYAYSTALPYLEQILKEYPSIEVVIDLHRDSGAKRVTEIDGESVAQVMLFNGLCRNAKGPIKDLENPYLQENLAFSLRMKLVGEVLYPDLMFKIYLKNYRYNMHVCEKSLLVELGTNQNTVGEARRAMPYLAEVLDQVLRAASP